MVRITVKLEENKNNTDHLCYRSNIGEANQDKSIKFSYTAKAQSFSDVYSNVTLDNIFCKVQDFNKLSMSVHPYYTTCYLHLFYQSQSRSLSFPYFNN